MALMQLQPAGYSMPAGVLMQWLMAMLWRNGANGLPLNGEMAWHQWLAKCSRGWPLCEKVANVQCGCGSAVAGWLLNNEM
jgi:hypothetical protein